MLRALVGLAVVDSTSFGTLVIPLVLLVYPRVRMSRIVVSLVTIGSFYAALSWVLGTAGVLLTLDGALSATTTVVHLFV